MPSSSNSLPGSRRCWIYAYIVPHEALWRTFAKPSSQEALIQAAQIPARELVKSMLAVVTEGKWPTLDECIPPGSILDAVDRMFFAGTDIPRELPFFTVLHYISALLLQRGVEISVANMTTLPDMWTIALAASGSGKSWTQKIVNKALGGSVEEFPEAASAAKFIECLRDNNRGLWLRDEFAQYLRSIETQTHMVQVKDFLLRTYDNNKISHQTKVESVEVEVPALTIFGTTPFATIKNYLTAESLTDGFAQRFAFVVAERDARPLKPIYDVSESLPAVEAMWKKQSSTAFHPVYYVDKVAVAAYEQAFAMILERSGTEKIADSFSRRIMWRSMKYALLYHVMLGKTDDKIHAEDMMYAARLAALNLRDLRKLMDEYELPVFGALAQVCKDFVLRRAGNGLKTSKRDLLAGVRKIGKANDAQEMLDYLKDDPDLEKHLELSSAKQKAAAAPTAKGFSGKAVLKRNATDS